MRDSFMILLLARDLAFRWNISSFRVRGHLIDERTGGRRIYIYIWKSEDGNVCSDGVTLCRSSGGGKGKVY